ncbi:MAG: hypothetical protein LIO45_00495, partial [Clostridiales bacterium]|nr:hypothetical protein [Clostridiales bacterium]
NQIVVVDSDGTKTRSAPGTFKNVAQSYDLTLTKTGTTALEHDILTSEATLEYSLDVTVTASGPINGLTLTDSGLTVTETWSGLSANATKETANNAAYLDNEYTIQSVSIPIDATYDYSSLVFNTGSASTFSPSIKATVTFYAADDAVTYSETAVLTDMTGEYWTVTPNSSVKSVRFTVTWYDEGLETSTGYQLGSNFKVSSTTGNTVGVVMKIDQQNGGTLDYYAVATIRNSASVTYNYTNWPTERATGSSTVTMMASDTWDTAVPNVTAPVIAVEKTVEDESGGKVAKIGDKLLYTITVSNSSSSLALDNPIILDLLPQGLVAVTDGDVYANVTITGSTNDKSTLKIDTVYHKTSDGYTLVAIQTTGSLAAGEEVTITLEAQVDSTVLNYLSTSGSLINYVWVTSATEGNKYHDNEAGSAFMGSLYSWAGALDETSTQGAKLAELMTALNVTGYGYVNDSADITYQGQAGVYALKEVQGDQDGDDWYHGSDGGKVTTVTSEDDYGKGYANFRLTVTNRDTSTYDKNIVIMDIVPKEGGASNNGITKNWSLNFDRITSVTITDAAGDTKTYDDSYYTLWYYTGELSDDDDITTMESAYSAAVASTEGTGWVKADDYSDDKSDDKSDITAFAVEFDSSVMLAPQATLQLIYKTLVPVMKTADAESKAHLATYNDFKVFYYLGNATTTGTTEYKLSSNYVYVLLETETVGVGGMAWIDVDGDGVQESEDVTPSAYDSSTDVGGTEENTASTYNSRKSTYTNYSVVTTLLNSITVTLETYQGSVVSDRDNDSLSGSTNPWRFLFDELTTANISSLTNPYGDDGINWTALAGSSNAAWYRLVATIAGDNSIKYSLTTATTDVKSYDPDDLYTDGNERLTDSNFRVVVTDTESGVSTYYSGKDTITTGSTTAYSEKFFLYSNEEWNLAEDLGLVIYRDLTITKQTSDNSNLEAGTTFALYGPYTSSDEFEVTDDPLQTITLEANETTCTFEDLLYFKVYVVVEIDADDSYELDEASATGTNIVSYGDTGTVTLNGKTCPAWVLNVPTADEANKDIKTDPTAYNTVCTDHMTVKNAKKLPLSFTKVAGDDFDAENATGLSGAVFELYSAGDVGSDGTPNLFASPLYTATSADDGTVTFTEPVLDEQGNETGDTTDVLLESGTYYLYETTAPTGYVLPATNYWVVEVDTAHNTVTITDFGENGLLQTDSQGDDYYILNYKEYELPLTGGTGTTMYIVTGLIVMATAAAVYVCTNRRRRRRSR